MKRILLFITMLLCTVNLIAQNEYEVKQKISSSLQEFMSAISYVNDEEETILPISISSDFSKGNYFSFNGKEMKLEHFIEDYCYATLQRKIVNHTLAITHNNIQKLSDNQSDKRWHVKGKLKREYASDNDAVIADEDISFVVLLNGFDEQIGVLAINFDERIKIIKGNLVDYGVSSHSAKNELVFEGEKAAKSKPFVLKPENNRFNFRLLSSFDKRGSFGIGFYGNHKYFQYGFDAVFSIGYGEDNDEYDEDHPSWESSQKSLEKYFYELSSNNIYATNGTTLWKTENEYIRPKTQLTFAPGVNLKYFSVECGLGIFMAERIVTTETVVNTYYRETEMSATKDNKNYFLLRPTLTGYIPGMISVSISYVYCSKAKPFNSFMFGLGLYI